MNRNWIITKKLKKFKFKRCFQSTLSIIHSINKNSLLKILKKIIQSSKCLVKIKNNIWIIFFELHLIFVTDNMFENVQSEW